MDEKRFIVDIGMKNLPFPMDVISKTNPQGQRTVADISIQARIMKEFEAIGVDRFIQILHQHREKIGTNTLKQNIMDYVHELKASMVKIDFEYPYFVEKLTPVSKEKCLVRYKCIYQVKYPSADNKPKAIFRIEVPAITSYPQSFKEASWGLFGQLSLVLIEIESDKDIFPEYLVELVDTYALTPVYSFLTEEDQKYVIKRIHEEKKTSVVMMDEIKNELAGSKDISWYSIHCANFGMLHSYSTFIQTEKSMWVPFSGYSDEV